jgi:hypothetical protein
MILTSAGLGAKNDGAGENQQQFTSPDAVWTWTGGGAVVELLRSS